MSKHNNLPGTQPTAAGRTKVQPGSLPPYPTLQALLDATGIVSWDLLLVGDGSGSGWDGACGWATALVDNNQKLGRFYHGGMNLGSVNLAEQMPYMQAMLHWLNACEGRELIKRRGVLQVHIVTDSETVAKHGSQASDFDQPLPRTQYPLWAAWREMIREGFQFQFHWAPRASSTFNIACDCIASMARRSVLTQSTQFMDDEFRSRLMRADRQAAAAAGNNPAAAAAIAELQAVVREAAGRLNTLASQTAASVERVQLVDPRNQAPINVHDLC